MLGIRITQNVYDKQYSKYDIVHWVYFVTCNTTTNVIIKMKCTCDNCPATIIKYCA